MGTMRQSVMCNLLSRAVDFNTWKAYEPEKTNVRRDFMSQGLNDTSNHAIDIAVDSGLIDQASLPFEYHHS